MKKLKQHFLNNRVVKYIRKDESNGNRQFDSKRYSNFTQLDIYIILFISIISIIILDLMFYSSTLEDAYITFRYSKHFSEGYGFGAWNLYGERVEGYTSFLWMIIIALSNKLGLDVRIASKIIGIFCHIIMASLLISFPILPKKDSYNNHDILSIPNVAVLSGVFLSFYLPLSFYSTSGMETLLFTVLVLIFYLTLDLVQYPFMLPIATVLLIITRPEGAVITCVGIFFAFINRKLYGESSRYLKVSASFFVLTNLALLGYRIIIFGELVPNTFWAKAAGSGMMQVKFGLIYICEWIINHQYILLFSICSIYFNLVLFSKNKFKNWPINCLCTFFLLFLFTVYVIKIGGDNFSAFPFWRHFVHLFPLISLIFCYAIVRLWPRDRYFQLFVISVIIMVTNLSLLTGIQGKFLKTIIKKSMRTYPTLTVEEHNYYYSWLKKIANEKTIIATSAAGELPYVVDAIYLDILGLNTKFVAKNGLFDPNGPIDSKTDINWVLKQRPGIIDGYVSAEKIINGESLAKILNTTPRHQMNTELLTAPIFQEEYLFIRNGPYKSLDRALFIRKSFWVNHPLKDKLDCVPINETSLATVKLNYNKREK